MSVLDRPPVQFLARPHGASPGMTTPCPTATPRYGRDPLWEKMLAHFMYRREDYLRHYHQRSNVKTAFSMIKTKFGASVRAKTPTAQVNEVLTKILCHNITAVIRAHYELGATPKTRRAGAGVYTVS